MIYGLLRSRQEENKENLVRFLFVVCYCALLSSTAIALRLGIGAWVSEYEDLMIIKGQLCHLTLKIKRGRLI